MIFTTNLFKKDSLNGVNFVESDSSQTHISPCKLLGSTCGFEEGFERLIEQHFDFICLKLTAMNKFFIVCHIKEKIETLCQQKHFGFKISN